MTLSISAISMREFGYDDLGFLSLAALYCSFSIASLFASSIVTKLGAKRSFMLTAALRLAWEVSFLAPATRFVRMNEGEDVASAFL